MIWTKTISATSWHYEGMTLPAFGIETASLNPTQYDAQPAGWLARLKLGFTRRNERTVLATRAHSGPLVVQKPLYPEGDAVCHTVILHPPGGIAGGDDLAITVDVGPQAHALATTPGAGKWYKANGAVARQQLAFGVGEQAVFEWLPQETILFGAAYAEMATHIKLVGTAAYAGWEIVCLGRRASGEFFESGLLRQRTEIRRDGKLIWLEAGEVKGGDAFMHSPVGLRGCPVFGSMLVAAGQMPAELLDTCREIAPPAHAHVGMTQVPGVFSARYLGHSAQDARHYFERLWAVLRPWYATRPAQRLRLWNT